MVPSRLIEIIFSRLWLIVLPVVLVPALVVSMTRSTPVYAAAATVWVAVPLGDGSLPIGHTNQYLTPAQNQAIVLNDLLKTDNFRREVLERSGALEPGSDTEALIDAMENRTLSVSFSGVNLMSVHATSPSAAESKQLVDAVVETYLERATEQLAQDSETATQYFTQQLAVAEAELDKRKIVLNDYLNAHPEALDPQNPASMSLDYRTIVDQVTSQTAVVSGLSQRVQEVQLRKAGVETGKHSYFAVQDPATVPANPLPTGAVQRFGLPMAALIFGMAISAAHVFIRYRTDHTIRSASDVEKLGVQALAIVPEIRPGSFLARWTPYGLVQKWTQRDFARHTARGLVVPQHEEPAQ